MGLPYPLPAVFYLRNRTLIFVVAPPIAVYCFTRILANQRSEDPWLNWLAGLILWLFLLFLALRRRLALTDHGLEYTDSFTRVHIPWEQVTRLISRKALGFWNIEGVEVWTKPPRPKDLFIDLTQFNRSWRYGAIGEILKARIPHLFAKAAPKQSAA